MRGNRVLAAAGLLLFAAMAWGGMFAAAKVALPLVDAFYLTSLRYGIAALVFLAILVAAEGRRGLRVEGKGWRLAALGSVGFAGFGLFAFAGLAHSRPEHGAIIMALQPLIAALVVWATRGARPARTTLASIALALAGVALVITRGSVQGVLDGATVYGDFLILLGATSWVIYTVGAASFPGWSPLRYTTLSCLAGLPAVLGATAVATLLGRSRAPLPADLNTVLWPLVYMIVFASVLAVLAWNMGNRALGSANGVLFINFVPVTAFAVEVAQGHHFETAELLGALMVIVALVSHTLGLTKAPAAKPSPQPCPAAALQTGD